MREGAADESDRPGFFGRCAGFADELEATIARLASRCELMRISFLLVLALVVSTAPAAAQLLDEEPSNDSISTATIQLTPSAAVNVGIGRFTLEAGAGDIDFIGVGGLFAGDVVTVSTTPLTDSPHFESPDTIAGVFDSDGTELCLGDDAFNNDLDVLPRGFGSLCRFELPADGDYFVGVTGWSSVPFDGSHFESGEYSVAVTITALPEPGALRQIAAGLLALTALATRRRRANDR